MTDDEWPYWQRHIGKPVGPVDRRAVKRLGLAFIVPIAVFLIVVVVVGLISELM